MIYKFMKTAHFSYHCENIDAADHSARLILGLNTCLHRGGARYCLKHTDTKKSVPFLQYGHTNGVGVRGSVFSQTGCGVVELVFSSDDFNSLSRQRLEGAKIP